MVNLLNKIFKKSKMTIEQLKQENESFKAQIAGIAFNLDIADKKIKMYESQFESMQKYISDLKAEIEHLNMISTTANKNQNDSRYY